jgi:hypothetical protein
MSRWMDGRGPYLGRQVVWNIARRVLLDTCGHRFVDNEDEQEGVVCIICSQVVVVFV